MIDTLDQLFVGGDASLNDDSLSYLRVVGDTASNLLCFLPWRMSFAAAQRLGVVPDRFLACYQLPLAIVSSEPALCARAMMLVVDDAAWLMRHMNVPAEDAIMVGLSLGTAPATMLANMMGSRLCSVTSADRGDLMLWQSPAAVSIKKKAQGKGYRSQDFKRALAGLNPIDNMKSLRSDSIFVSADRDLFVPEARRAAFVCAARQHVPKAYFLNSDSGHVRTIRAAAAQLNDLLTMR
jgi:pimeloyl-ACP methyl ester carboxylesterase